MKHSYYTYFLREEHYGMLWPSDENRPYRITQAGMMSKFRKWHLREPKFAKFPRGACPRTPLDACAFGTNNYSLFSITWGWNLCTIWVPNHRIFHIISWETIIVEGNLQSSPKILETPIYAHPFPSAMMRCDCKVMWLQQHCKREGETKRIKIVSRFLSEIVGSKIWFWFC